MLQCSNELRLYKKAEFNTAFLLKQA